MLAESQLLNKIEIPFPLPYSHYHQLSLSSEVLVTFFSSKSLPLNTTFLELIGRKFAQIGLIK